MPAGPGGGQAMRLVETQPEPQPAMTPPQLAPEPAEAPRVAIATLADIAALADRNRDLAFKVQFKHSVRPVSIQPGRIEVSLTPDAPRTMLNDLSAKLKEWTGRNWIVSLSREEGGATLAEEEERRRESAMTDARADPAVAAILDAFPGARIVNVRLPQAVEEADAADEAVAADPGVDPVEDDDDI